MQDYPERATVNNPVPSLLQGTRPTPVGQMILAELQKYQLEPPVSGHGPYNIEGWATRALAALLPWVWNIRQRINRAWHRNVQGYENGAHCLERGHREAQLERDLDLIKRRAFYTRTERLPRLLQFRALKLTGALHRLLDETTWWKTYNYPDHRVGKYVDRVYLPEDTWSAQTCLHWCVERLEQLYTAAGGIRTTPGQWVGGGAPGAPVRERSSTEKSTPPLRPFEDDIRRVSTPRAKNEEAWLAEITRRGEQRARGEPVTWSTT